MVLLEVLTEPDHIWLTSEVKIFTLKENFYVSPLDIKRQSSPAVSHFIATIVFVIMCLFEDSSQQHSNRLWRNKAGIVIHFQTACVHNTSKSRVDRCWGRLCFFGWRSTKSLDAMKSSDDCDITLSQKWGCYLKILDSKKDKN